jgi:hypothetical protein
LEAERAGLAASSLMRAAEDSIVLFGQREQAIASLHEVATECSQDDWNGEGALPVDPDAVARAETFLRALPDGIRMPDCSPEPDGSVSLDWSEPDGRLFSISVGAGNRLAFAWLDGNDKGHGVARFDGTVVPERILFDLRTRRSRSHASVRTA